MKTGPQAKRLSGDRLHLQHGPIDLIIGADGNRERAFSAAFACLETVLSDLIEEWSLISAPTSDTSPQGSIARRMHAATHPFSAVCVTPMAAVAGAVADTILEAMTRAASLKRAYVNNGGDIALHLTEGTRFSLAMAAHNGSNLGRIDITHSDPVRGIATSGRHGRSHSLGIADSVTVLAATAAKADAAATLIANAVDLPGHPSITRVPAEELSGNTDLGSQAVVTRVGHLSRADTCTALDRGVQRADAYLGAGLIHGASLHLNGESRRLNLPAGALAHA